MKTILRPECSSKELKILGDYWTLAIIQSLGDGEKRFCEIERSLTGINPTTLTNRLKKLESLKLINRRAEAVDKISVSYSLSDKGHAILPILNQIRIFAQQYL